MKKFVLLLCLFALTFTSCEGPTGPMGPPGLDVEFFVKECTVRSQDWNLISTGRYASLYQYVVDINIGDYAYENELVNVYLFQDDNGKEVQTPLPIWIPYTEGNYTWLEGFNFDAGTIAFYVDWKNGERPNTCYFRVVVAP